MTMPSWTKVRSKSVHSLSYLAQVARRCVVYPRAWIHRRLCNDITVVGITGSAGKTTTKDLCAAMLSQLDSCVSTDRSENDRFPVAETVLSIEKRHRFAVFELSGSKPGYLDFSLQITRPTIGVLTLIGRDHYSAFRSREAIAEEKSKLVMRLPENGVAVLNIDDPLIRGIGERCSRRKIWVGRSEGATLRMIEARSVWPEPLTLVIEYQGADYEVPTRLHGTQLALSVLSALGVAVALDIPLQQAIDAVGRAEATEGRMQIVTAEDGVVFVRDDWKAPHWSIEAPFEFMRFASVERKIVVIGTVSDSDKSPSRRYPGIARNVRQFADLAVFVGRDASKALKARTGPTDESIQAFSNLAQAAAYLQHVLQAGDLVLLKGTNKQDHLVRLILNRREPIGCWESKCGLSAFCDRCERLYIPQRPNIGRDVDTSDSDGVLSALPDFPEWTMTDGASELIVGLGNPGAHYSNTPHNLGYRVVERLAESFGGTWERAPEGLLCQIDLGHKSLILLKPDVSMNLSGAAVRQVIEGRQGGIGQCTIVHDDMDLPLGITRFKRGGGDGGHNGLRSIVAALGSDAFCRIRVGARKPGDVRRALDLVLERFQATEASVVDDALDVAVAVLCEKVAISGSNAEAHSKNE